MGLRSFVALPVDKGGTVLRFQYERNLDDAESIAIANLAYGINIKQALFIGLPYKLSPDGGSRTGDLNLLYRLTFWQRDRVDSTRRFAMLAGMVAPTEQRRNVAAQAGFVFTAVQKRTEWDLDALYIAGSHIQPDRARYDVSWQYRVSPSHYPDWGIGPELNVVLELNGRWVEHQNLIHQVTAGLQWIHPRWILEGGVYQNISGPGDIHFLLSTRMHF